MIVKPTDRWITSNRIKAQKTTHYQCWKYNKGRFIEEGWLTIAKVKKLYAAGHRFFRGEIVVRGDGKQEMKELGMFRPPWVASKITPRP